MSFVYDKQFKLFQIKFLTLLICNLTSKVFNLTEKKQFDKEVDTRCEFELI